MKTDERKGKVRTEIYYDAKRSWNFYRKQAYGEALMPDQAKLESIKNQWLTLLPNINSSESFFSDLGKEELIYRK